MFAENILLSVDGQVYGSIVAPPGGFATQKSNLKLHGTENWPRDSVMAPFDKEVRKYCYTWIIGILNTYIDIKLLGIKVQQIK